MQLIHTAAELRDGEEVGEHLAGMEIIGQSIDDRHRGILRHFFHTVLPISAPHDGVCHARKHPRGVSNRLATAQLGAGLVDDQRVAAQLGNADGEAGASASAVFVEKHSHSLRAGKRLGIETVFAELHAQFEDLLLLFMGDVVIAKHVTQLMCHESSFFR